MRKNKLQPSRAYEIFQIYLKSGRKLGRGVCLRNFVKNSELRTLFQTKARKKQRLIGKFRKILSHMFSLRRVSFAPKEMRQRTIQNPQKSPRFCES